MCALPKAVKKGGTYFKGYQLSVGAAPGDYVLHISTGHQTVVNNMQLIPDAYGIGDYATIGHYVNTTAGAVLVNPNTGILADTIYNMGAYAGITLNFPSLEPFLTDEDLRVTYTNVAGVAVVVNVLVEFIR